MPHQDEARDERLLTAQDIAEQLQLTPGWVLEAARTGDIPCVELGRYKRFRRADVDEWIESKATRRRS